LSEEPIFYNFVLLSEISFAVIPAICSASLELMEYSFKLITLDTATLSKLTTPVNAIGLKAVGRSPPISGMVGALFKSS